jgi:hypothetical protein
MLNKILADVKKLTNRFTNNPRYIFMRIIGRFNALRSLMVSLWHQDFLEISNLSTKSIFPELEINKILSRLKKDGYFTGIYLPTDLVTSLVDFASSSICYANRHPEKGFYYKDKTQVLEKHPNFLLGSFYNLDLSCPAVKLIEEDPQILKIAAYYLKSKPILQGTNMWWSFAVNASEQERSDAAQLYHMDLDDYRFIKFFFYLTNVDEHGGPHMIVKGTHEKKKFIHQLKLQRFSDQEIINEYGSENITALCGLAGYGFIEDTLCFHKGHPPNSQDRLVIQVEFGLRDYGLQHSNIDPKALKQIDLNK